MTAPKAAAISERQGRAEGEPDRGADAGEQQHLRQIDREHAGAGGAERLQGRDDVALAIEMALHRIGDADAADQQRGQADQGQELGEVLDVALELPARHWCGVRMSQPASGNSRVAASAITALAPSLSLLRGRRSAIVPAHQTAGLQQAGRPQRLLADEERAGRRRCRPRACPARSRARRGSRWWPRRW